jgi:hypothetical protein
LQDSNAFQQVSFGFRCHGRLCSDETQGWFTNRPYALSKMAYYLLRATTCRPTAPPMPSVGRPRGKPPAVISSRPWIPVGHLGRKPVPDLGGSNLRAAISAPFLLSETDETIRGHFQINKRQPVRPLFLAHHCGDGTCAVPTRSKDRIVDGERSYGEGSSSATWNRTTFPQ